MAVLVEVVGKNYYAMIGGEMQKAPKGHKLVVAAVPKNAEGKLKVIKEVKDSEIVVNDTPEGKALREMGDIKAADALLEASKKEHFEKMAKREATKAAKAAKADDADADDKTAKVAVKK